VVVHAGANQFVSDASHDTIVTEAHHVVTVFVVYIAFAFVGAVLSIVNAFQVTTVVFQARSVAVILSVAVVKSEEGTVQV
jgi:hypothetical protein